MQNYYKQVKYIGFFKQSVFIIWVVQLFFIGAMSYSAYSGQEKLWELAIIFRAIIILLLGGLCHLLLSSFGLFCIKRFKVISMLEKQSTLIKKTKIVLQLNLMINVFSLFLLLFLLLLLLGISIIS